MTTGKLISLGGGTGWSLAVAIGLVIAILLMLIIAVASIGFLFVHRGDGGFRHLWVTGIAALAAAVFFAYQGAGFFTSVAGIEIDPSGTWNLYAPAGNRIESVTPAMRRSLLLWAEVNSYETAPYFDSLYGTIHIENDREYRLRGSDAFDLLILMGYGPYWIDHANLTVPEEKKAQEAGAHMVFAGTGKNGGIVLPLHAYDPSGIALVRAFLAARAR
jgi:hypothetical protein